MSPISLLSTTPSFPSVAEITLPPGSTLPQFVSLQDSLVTTAIAAAVAFGILICDYLNLFSHEIKCYHNLSWCNPASGAFVLLRYSGILATFPALLLTSIQNKYCQTLVMSSQIGLVLVVASSGFIFAFRVSAMWGGHKAISTLVGIMYVVMLGCWCAVVPQYRTETGPPAPFGSNCHIQPLPSWAPIAYASSVAFDAVVLLLAAFKLTITSSPARHTTSYDTLVYILITTLANVTVLVIQALGPRLDLIKPTVVPFSTVITAALGARAYVNLQPFSEREPPTELVLPLASMGDNQSIRTFVHPATPRYSSSGTATPQVDFSKTHSVEFPSSDVPRPDTPFGSYDDNTPKDTKFFHLQPVFTRETVVIVE